VASPIWRLVANRFHINGLVAAVDCVFGATNGADGGCKGTFGWWSKAKAKGLKAKC